MPPSTACTMEVPSNRAASPDTRTTTFFDPNLPRELWTQILSHVPPQDLWNTCRLVSRDFRDEAEFVMRTIYIARRLYLVRTATESYTFSHFSDGIVNKLAAAHYKPSLLAKGPKSNCEAQPWEISKVVYPFSGPIQYVAPTPRAGMILLHAEIRDLKQAYPACNGKHCPGHFDMSLGSRLGGFTPDKDGWVDIGWRPLFTRYVKLLVLSARFEKARLKRDALLNKARVKFGMNFRRWDDPARWDAQARKVGWLHSPEDDWAELAVVNEGKS